MFFLQVYSLSLSLCPLRREPFLWSASLGKVVVPDSSSVPVHAKYVYSLPSAQNSVFKFKHQIVIKFIFQSISYV
jgi:hypothetical protein